MHAFLSEQSGPIAFAHRGGAAGGAENTLTAFGRAVGLGYRYLETDVRASADGTAVIFHDADLRRLTGTPGRIESCTWERIQRLRVDGEGVPSLRQALAAWPDVRWNIDVKTDAAVGPTLAAIRDAEATDRVLLASFSGSRLARIRQAAPEVATCLTPGEITALRLWGRPPTHGVAAQVPVRYGPVAVVTPRFVAAAHAHGLAVHVWTVDEPGRMAALLDLGVDGIMTDRVDVLREVYRERGLWTQ